MIKKWKYKIECVIYVAQLQEKWHRGQSSEKLFNADKLIIILVIYDNLLIFQTHI